MKNLLWNTFALSIVWDFLFEHDAHHIVSKRGWEILNNKENKNENKAST
jgi:hypothetical protein